MNQIKTAFSKQTLIWLLQGLFVLLVCALVRFLCMFELNLPWLVSARLTWLLKVLIGRGPGLSDLQQTAFHSREIHLRAVALGVVHGTLAPAVVVPTHQLAFLITADVAEGSLHKASPQILREDGLKTCSQDKNGAHEYVFEIPGRMGVISAPFLKHNICLASYLICWDCLMFLFILHCSATLIVNHYWDSLQYTAGTREERSCRVIEAKFILTHWCCSYKVARQQTLWQFHQKLGEFNYGCPTLQMNLVFRALNQNGADRIKVVIVTASERACSCFGHLKGEKQAHNNSYWERHTPQTHTRRERKWWYTSMFSRQYLWKHYISCTIWRTLFAESYLWENFEDTDRKMWVLVSSIFPVVHWH